MDPFFQKELYTTTVRNKEGEDSYSVQEENYENVRLEKNWAF